MMRVVNVTGVWRNESNKDRVG